jgi:hypothetical protein
MRKIILLAIVTLNFSSLVAQSSTYWQQHVDYKMDVTMDVKNYQYKGKQELVYSNNSSDFKKGILSFV